MKLDSKPIARAGLRGGRLAAVASVAVIAVVGASRVRAQGDPRFEEHAIATVPKGIEVERGVAFAADGSKVAYVGTKDGKSVPVIGAQVFETSWYVGAARFSADGRVAHHFVDAPAKRVQKAWVLIDGKKAPETVGISEFEWSPDGRKLAFVTMPECKIADDRSRTGDCFLVIDGKKGEKQRAVSQIAWSADSAHVVASAERSKGGYAILLDNKTLVEGGRYDGPVFSPDGSRIAYASEQVRNGALAMDVTAIKWFVACGEQRLGLDFDRAASPVFSPDGKRIAFKAERADRVGISIDGAAPQGEWAFVTSPVFSRDGARMAFTASDDCNVVPGLRVIRMGESMVSGGAWQVVLDGKASGEKFAAIRDLVFSPDGKRLACRAKSGDKWRIVCGARKSDDFDFVGPPAFSPDGTKLAFGVQSGREFAWKVLAVGE